MWKIFVHRGIFKMKKAIVWLILIAFILTAAAAAVLSQTIRVAPPAPVFTDAERHTELAKRRAAVAEQMEDDSVLIMFSAEPRLYTNDVDYVYRQENNLFYLTELNQANIGLVIHKSGNTVTETLFVPERSYFSEVWNGRMYSVEDAARISGIKTIVAGSEFSKFIEAAAAGRQFAANGTTIPSAEKIYLLLPMGDMDANGKREFAREAAFSERSLAERGVMNARPIFDRLRHIKSPYELKILQHAIDITTEAQMRAMAVVGKARHEYEVQAEVEYTFRRRNADFWGYPSIVGCGPNATTLHYVESQGDVNKGDVLLMDVGAEYKHYTADVTRSFPVSGRFTKEQADIYRIVYNAQEAAAAAAKPGASFSDISAAADKVIRDGLFELGLITDKNSMQHRIWYMHGLGHWLGMNVHDVGSMRRPLEPGMVFTNEPGIYIRAEALDNLPQSSMFDGFAEKVRPVFERYKWMTKALPRKLEDVEAFMKRNRKLPSH